MSLIYPSIFEILIIFSNFYFYYHENHHRTREQQYLIFNFFLYHKLIINLFSLTLPTYCAPISSFNPLFFSFIFKIFINLNF
jgi:hypothetical protein